MKPTLSIATRCGLRLEVEVTRGPEQTLIAIHAPAGKPAVLHWGLRRTGKKDWVVPAQEAWPSLTKTSGSSALQTPLHAENGAPNFLLRLPTADAADALEFVLFFPNSQSWDNNERKNYQVPLAKGPPPSAIPESALEVRPPEGEVLCERSFELPTGGRLNGLVVKQAEGYRALFRTDLPQPLRLHWGLAQRSPHEWLLPPETVRGPGAEVFQNLAVQTPFTYQDGIGSLSLAFPLEQAPLGIQFVLKQGHEPGQWLKQRGGNFYLPVNPSQPKAPLPGADRLVGLAEEIVRAETTHNSWTLMHRFNLCHDLLDRAQGNLDDLAVIFVWLRFSAIRQLTWQRSYNTKPRELAHAQDRLTQKLASLYRSAPASRPLARLALGTVGRGGEGQRIRDEILNIMHRHHVKEVSGHFLEEWHQKLHNNTTPDDIVICEAYLEFLKSNGNLDRFHQTLQAGGVTRERLRSFERPIHTDPDFVPHIKDGLIHDFYGFLRILKASHSGTDLETAINSARHLLDGELHGLLQHLWDHRNDPHVPPAGFVQSITEARRRLSHHLSREQGLRELLYLDLALEQLVRGFIERNIHLSLGAEVLADLISSVLENVTLSYEDSELATCSRHWARLQANRNFGPDWALQAKSVVDRIGRALSTWIDLFYQLLQPKAEFLGQGFNAEPWTITLFSEEVVRGNSVGFVLSILLRHLDPVLRNAAHIGSWQIVSRGQGAGKIVVAASLREIQRNTYSEPTVVVAGRVMGDEEVPQGVTAVIAPDVTDIVSHVAVRARNAGLLFATCHDPELFERFKTMQGRWVRLKINAGGDVELEETQAIATGKSPARQPISVRIKPRKFTRNAIGMSEFKDSAVGAKACHLAELRQSLPDWIALPESVAVPFGVAEKVLALPANEALAKKHAELLQAANAGSLDVLPGLRDVFLALSAPPELPEALKKVMDSSGLPWPADWDKAWHRIKEVWASKWNERACLSRRAAGLRHEDLMMSVLIQQVVPAEYAFVLHTVHPSTGNPRELFGEVVLGLGETLVGNYPGRALSFVWDKDSGKAALLSYPGKSQALRGGGLIFRSDSNGEDLEGYAGAGLYDSVLLEPPQASAIDYTQEPLVWDAAFRARLLADIARVGLEVEKACGSPQDIEGAFAHGRYHVVQTRPQAGR
jgi:alpha-glucan,water dikinase